MEKLECEACFFKRKKGLTSIFHASRSSPSFFFVSKNKNKTSQVVFNPSANAPRMKKKERGPTTFHAIWRHRGVVSEHKSQRSEQENNHN
jgi:hypothetical protein